MKEMTKKEITTMKDMTKKVAELYIRVREQVPLVHQITNYVTVGDCANATLAIGGSPIMADDLAETEEITGISSALVLNIGTLNQRTLGSMIASGKRANDLGIPVVFDPVGAGASTLRNEATKAILDQVKVTILRGNLSEISFVAGVGGAARGVDSSEADAGNDGVAIAKKVAQSYQCVVVITGEMDLVSDGERTITINNGHKMLSKVTGTGCMATALVGAFSAITEDHLSAAVAGIAAMGIAGEIAYEKAGTKGTGSFRVALIDAISLLDSNVIETRSKFHEA